MSIFDSLYYTGLCTCGGNGVVNATSVGPKLRNHPSSMYVGPKKLLHLASKQPGMDVEPLPSGRGCRWRLLVDDVFSL